MPTVAGNRMRYLMMHAIRTFLGIFVIAAVIAAVALMPSNASAMVTCAVDQTEHSGSDASADRTSVDNHTELNLPGKISHAKDHCAGHLCVVADMLPGNIGAGIESLGPVVSWDRIPLVRSSSPEGLRRPPRA